MTVSLPSLLILILATWQTVEIVRHSRLESCAGLRAWAEISDSFVAQVVNCPWCLSVWVAAGLAAGWTLPLATRAAGPLSVPRALAVGAVVLVRILILALAIARGANLGNDLGYPVSRTPKADRG